MDWGSVYTVSNVHGPKGGHLRDVAIPTAVV